MSFISEKIILTYDLGETGLEQTAREAFGGVKNLPEGNIAMMAGNTVKVLLGLLGVFFIILIIIGGFQWMTAQGNEERIDKARKLISNAIIGLIIVIGAYALAYFILQQILPAGLQ